jgi:hypothetical protein
MDSCFTCGFYFLTKSVKNIVFPYLTYGESIAGKEEDLLGKPVENCGCDCSDDDDDIKY